MNRGLRRYRKRSGVADLGFGLQFARPEAGAGKSRREAARTAASDLAESMTTLWVPAASGGSIANPARGKRGTRLYRG